MKPALRTALLSVLFLLSPPALALDGTGVLCGTVLDKQTWEVVKDVVVTATSPSLMGEQTVVTNEDGFYRIPQLPSGVYRLRFEHEKFEPIVRTVVVRLNQTYRMNVRIEKTSMSGPIDFNEPSISLPWSLRRPQPPPLVRSPGPFDMGQTHFGHGSGKLMPPLPPTASAQAVQSAYFQGYGVNPTVSTSQERVSTFPVDGDVGNPSYSRASGALETGIGTLPREEWVRVEEFINTFAPGGQSSPDAPFAVHVEGFPSPSRPDYHVLLVSLKAPEAPPAWRKPSHLVFTIEVTSLKPRKRRLDIAKEALRALLDTLDARDRVSIIAYNSKAQLVLPPTSALQRDVLLGAIDGIQADDEPWTKPYEGLDLAYSHAAAHKVEGGINRVILCSTGMEIPDKTPGGDLWQRVRDFAAQGITLSTVGLDLLYANAYLVRLAREGGGNHAFVGWLDDASIVAKRNLGGLRPPVARDAKAQLEFVRDSVVAFRLVGYEHRIMHDRERANELVAEGQLLSGQVLTALYEVKLRTQKVENLGTLRLRYKAPEDGSPRELVQALPGTVLRDAYASASPSSRLAYVAAAFAEKLRGSYWVRALSWQQLIDLFEGVGAPQRGRPEVEKLGALIRRAASLDARGDPFEQ